MEKNSRHIWASIWRKSQSLKELEKRERRHRIEKQTGKIDQKSFDKELRGVHKARCTILRSFAKQV